MVPICTIAGLLVHLLGPSYPTNSTRLPMPAVVEAELLLNFQVAMTTVDM